MMQSSLIFHCFHSSFDLIFVYKVVKDDQHEEGETVEPAREDWVDVGHLVGIETDSNRINDAG